MLPFELTKDTPYLALSGELWSVFYEYFNRNWPCYKGFLLYIENNEYSLILWTDVAWYLSYIYMQDTGPFSLCIKHQGLLSLSGQASYHNISWSLEDARFWFILFK